MITWTDESIKDPEECEEVILEHPLFDQLAVPIHGVSDEFKVL
jgi:hypothetical protein